jgi:hypothetical protein
MLEESKIINWGESFFSLKYYTEGKNTMFNHVNPYTKHTNAWFNWNHGYNDNL